jgi:transcriptional repressor NrdR
MMTLRAGPEAPRQLLRRGAPAGAPVRATRPTMAATAFHIPHILWLHSCCSTTGGVRSAGPGRGCVAVRCPFCRHSDCRVIDSREVDDGQATRRRRSCAACGRRFTTVEESVLAVVKRSGVTEPFSREKVVGGVRRACQGRPVDEDALAQLAHRVEETVRAGGAAEVPSHEVGLAILGPLRELDEVAYLRFASVYRSFSSIEDFEKEIADLRRPGGDTGS